MPILRPTNIEGRVHSILVNTKPDDGIATENIGTVKVSYEGFVGDWHSGVVRESCVRTRRQYEVGTEIRNSRQNSIVSVENLESIAAKMEVSEIEPEWLGANILLSDILNFTLVPPSSRLIFSSGASLVVDMENELCKYPGDVIEEYHPRFGHLFSKSAFNLRGVMAWVEKEGNIGEGDSISLHIPPQRIYEI